MFFFKMNECVKVTSGDQSSDGTGENNTSLVFVFYICLCASWLWFGCCLSISPNIHILEAWSSVWQCRGGGNVKRWILMRSPGGHFPWKELSSSQGTPLSSCESELLHK